MKKLLLSFSSLGMIATTATTVACSTPMYKTNEIRTGIIEGYYTVGISNAIPPTVKRIFLWHNIIDIQFNSEFEGVDGWYETIWYDEWGQPISYFQFDYYARVITNNSTNFYIDSKNLDRIMRT